MKYHVKNVKTFMGMDCPGYNASLYRGNEKVANVVNDGSGGETMIDWVSRDEETLLNRHIEGKTVEFDNDTLAMDADLFIGVLIDAFLDRRKFVRLCKTKTVVKLRTDKKGDYRIINIALTPKSRAGITAACGDRFEFFVNDKIDELFPEFS